LGNVWKVLQWKGPLLQPNGIFHGHLVHFAVSWYTFSRFGMLRREKSGNPGFVPKLFRVGGEILMAATIFALVVFLCRGYCFCRYDCARAARLSTTEYTKIEIT
jgi:hypothetical protein